MALTTIDASPPLTATTLSAAGTPLLCSQILIRSEPVLPKLKSCKNLQEIKQLHSLYTKHGLTGDDPAVLKELVFRYSQMGSSESLEYAQKAFKILKKNKYDWNSSVIYLYNSLIRGNSLAGNYCDAILLYVDMLINGVEPDNYTFPFVLSACAKRLILSEGRQLHDCIVKKGYHNDVFVSNSLVYYYGECGETDGARKVFDEMTERNVVSWTSLICGYARREWHQEAVSLFFKMVEEGIEPNEVTIVSVISACAKLGDMNLVERVLEYVERLGLSFNAVMVNALVDMYMKCGAAEKARELFDKCIDKNLVLYNTLMTNYVKLGKVEATLGIFCKMLDVGLKPDRVTMLSLIALSAELGDFSFGMQCHAYVFRHNLERWDCIGNSLIDMYTKSGKQEWACRLFDQMPNKTIVSWNSLLAGVARNGDPESAQGVFNVMPERNIVSWNTMIGALVQESFFIDAIELFHSMQKDGVIPDEVTMVSVVSACGYLGSLDLAKWTYNYIQKYTMHCNIRLQTALVDMFARCGDPQSAMKLFGVMKERDVSAWTAAIGAMAMEGNGERALKLFHDMLGEGIKPDKIAFTKVLTACSHAGLVKQGMDLFNTMKEQYGIIPHIIHYGCIVDLLGRAGLMNEALNFITTMPFKPNAEIWSSFLGACRTHKNEKMAEIAEEMIMKSDCDKTGVHVLLSNIYASAGKWSDVSKIRTGMKEQGLKKTPGSSSIEVNGAVHEFTSGDEPNVRTASMLKEMNCRLREVGYVPDLSNVLLDVDEGEKELLLGRHCEKLAIAFGLVSSGRGAPIRVVNNLRMCSDCHAFTKMVSEVYNREIVVRDINRFHFFRQGSCSCCDYW